MSGLTFHALNLTILNHNPIHPELIRDYLSNNCEFKPRFLILTDYQGFIVGFTQPTSSGQIIDQKIF